MAEREAAVGPTGGAQRTAQGGLSAAHNAPAIDAEAAFVRVADDVYRLDAALTFATVPALHARGLARIAAAAGDLQFDLQRVGATDSAGLALLIDWLATAKARQRTLRYAQPSEALRALARLSDVESLITAEPEPVAVHRPSDSGRS